MLTDESQPLLRPAPVPRQDSDRSSRSSTVLPAPGTARAQRWSLRRHAVWVAPLGIATIILFIALISVLTLFVERQWAHLGDLPLDDDPVLARLHTSNIVRHLEALYNIARQHDNSRSVKTGYNASAAYVMQELRDRARCDIQVHHFQVPIWDQMGEPTLVGNFADSTKVSFQDSKDFWSELNNLPSLTYAFQNHSKTLINCKNFVGMRYGGQSASLTNQTVVHIPNYGCHISDFASVANKVALIEEPESSRACSVWDAAWNAEQANATAVIFYNSPSRTSLLFNRVRITDWKKGDPLMTIPVLASTRTVGLILEGAINHVRLHITTKTQITIEDTHNTLCVGRVGNDSQRIVIGAHLDSVPAGPGLVDNGSGSSSLLEMAIILSEAHQHFVPHSKLVFAFWGAEEIGLLGSREWVRSTRRDSPREWNKIAANINLDTLASPNFISLIHNGQDAPEPVRNASIQIQKAFETFYNLEKLPYKITSMTAGSGVLTGANERKSESERRKHGGLANAPLDPCYHQSCDTLENISQDALTITSRAALFVISRLAHHPDLLSYLSGQSDLTA
ncbi:hypothetical protein INT43_008358 [Umbelopsis isabellina]|uniref:Peptide hydrolase n=1 Tax=Mortierella isabellina TaxID=91625 RepID=A0A8H7PD06_MORIS|nr:hypothetical protein INT43_008358 [Umbelopsis isabellina]